MPNDRTVRFGVITIQNLAFDAMVSTWRRLETLSFDSLWVADHFVNPYDPTGPWFEGWTLLAALAAHTTRVRVGTLVTTITYRNPAVLARQAMTVDHIAHGRLELGIGAGGAPLDHSMTGTTEWQPRERAKRFDEFVHVVDLVLRGKQPSQSPHGGNFYPICEPKLQPATVQQPRPPLVLAAHGRKALGTVARYADVWNTLAGNDLSAPEALAVTRDRNQWLDEECARLGREPRALRRSFLVGRTPDTPFASSEAFVDFVGRYCEAGIDEFILYWVPGMTNPGVMGDAATLERIALEAIPRARDNVSAPR